MNEYVTESAFKKIYLLTKQIMPDYSIHTLRGSCETGSDDSRVHLPDYHQLAETKLGPVAVTFAPQYAHNADRRPASTDVRMQAA